MLAVAGLVVTGSAFSVTALADAIPVDPDTGSKACVSGSRVLRRLDPPGRYLLTVQNTCVGSRPITVVNWIPPRGLTVVRVNGAEGGRCSLSGGIISCTTELGAPACATCVPRDELTVVFSASGTYVSQRSGTGTPWPVLRHIPSV